MRSVKNYIETSLNESLLDDDDIFLDPENDKKVIEEWIKNNYRFSSKLTISDDFVVSCTRNVTVKNKSITSLTNGLFRWGKVDGFFDCGNCKNLKSLEGAPKEVGRDFDCCYCNGLIDLKGAPEKVGGDFVCSGCENLITLEGAPEKVRNEIFCANCNNLKITDSDRKKYRIME